MGLFFSRTTGGFYDDEIHERMPDDAAPMTRERHAELLAGQSAGHRIAAGDDGAPTLILRAAPRLAERRALAVSAVKAEALRRIETVAPIWRQLNAMRGEGVVDWSIVDAIRAASTVTETAIGAMPAAKLDHFDATAPDHWPA